MCSVSVIQDYFRTQVLPVNWTPPLWGDYQEVLRLLRKLDAELSQPECEEPAKAAWMREVEARLQSLEQAGRVPE